MTQIAGNVTAIILNGWRVNFASPLRDFEPVMAGARKLIEMALASPHKRPPRFIFSSTIGVFQSSSETHALRHLDLDS